MARDFFTNGGLEIPWALCLLALAGHWWRLYGPRLPDRKPKPPRGNNVVVFRKAK